MSSDEENMGEDEDVMELDISDDSSDEDDGFDPNEVILHYQLLCAKRQELSVIGPQQVSDTRMWSLIQTLGATLRLLAPAALLALLCGRDSPIMRLLQHCDRAIKNVLSPSPGQTDGVLRWLQECLPGDPRTTSLDSVWADGDVLCDIIESAVPGSCGGHKDEGLAHAQRLAEQYLGVTPIFSKAELAQKTLSTYQECRLTHYLCCVKEALSRMSPPASRTGSPLLNVQAYTLDYVTRGMGLITASKNKRSAFYIYPTAQQGLDPGDISVQIKGPDNCYGSMQVPVIYGKTHIIRKVFLNLGNRKDFMPVQLPLTQGISYMRAYDRMNVQKCYIMPKVKNDIDVSIFIRHDRVKVCYVPTTAGYHEISLISKGCHLIGSPFAVNVEVGSLERQESTDDFLDEDIPTEDTPKPERKVVFRIVDFVTEKMILTEDGRLERISSEDADTLEQTRGSIEDLTNKYKMLSNSPSSLRGPDLIEYQSNKHDNSVQIVLTPDFNRHFRAITTKVIAMLRVCKEFKNIAMSKPNVCKKITSPPDIVNSTRSDCFANKGSIEIADLRPELSDIRESAHDLRHKFKSKLSSFNATEDKFEEVPRVETEYSLNESNKDSDSDYDVFYKPNKNLFQAAASIEIIISSFEDDEDIVPQHLPPIEILPVLEELPERPKTPVFKILADADDEIDPKIFNEFELYKLEDQIFNSLEGYGDSYCPRTDHALNTSLTIVDDTFESGRASPSINFHIGEPVTPTRVLTPSSLEPDMDSIIEAPNLEEALVKYNMKIQKNRETDHCVSDDSGSFATPLRQTPYEHMTDSEILKMYEEPLASSDFYKIKQSEAKYKNATISNQNLEDSLHDFNIQKGGVSILSHEGERKNASFEKQESFDTNKEEWQSPVETRFNSLEIWDSAYISIDEVNSSPETNSNTSPRSDNSSKEKLFCIEETDLESSYTPVQDVDYSIDLSKVGPAELELWEAVLGKNNHVEVNRIENDQHLEQMNDYANFKSENTVDTNVKIHLKENCKEGANIQTNRKSLENDIVKTQELFEKALTSENLYLNSEIMKNQSLQKYEESYHVPENMVIAESNDSASDLKADAKLSTRVEIRNLQENITDTENMSISSVPFLETEINIENRSIAVEDLSDDNVNMSHIKNNRKENNSVSKQTLSKMVNEKKDYWDEKIKSYQNNEEKKNRTISRKTSPSIKRNDSLSKKRGRQVLTKVPSVTEKRKNSFEQPDETECGQSNQGNSLVAKWKDYWNEKVEKTKSPEHGHNITPKSSPELDIDNNEIFTYTSDPETSNGIVNEAATKKQKNHFLGVSGRKVNHFSALTCSDTPLDNKVNNDLLCYKYEPTPIDLNTLTKRIDTFLDTISNPSPIIELDESRFSTPEPLLSGVVSKRKDEFDTHRNPDTINNDNLLKINKDDERLTITWNKNSSERRIRDLQQMTLSPSPDYQYENIPIFPEFRTNDKKESPENNGSANKLKTYPLNNLEKPEKCFDSEHDENTFNMQQINEEENLKLSHTVSEIKAKIEKLSEKFASDARENFSKQRSKTMDIPNSKKVNKLKKCFSLDREHNAFSNNTLKKKIIKDSYFDILDLAKDSKEYLDETKDINLSTDSLPTLAERRERLEKHLKKRLIRNTREKNQQSSELKPIFKPHTETVSVIENSMTNDLDNDKEPIFKPIGSIVAVFENKLSPNKQDTSQTGRKMKTIKALAEDEWVKTSASVAETREGTKNTLEASLSAIPKDDSNTGFDKNLPPSTDNGTSHPSKQNEQAEDQQNEDNEKEIDTYKYKERFNKAKKFFQTLDEYQKCNIKKKEKKLNECEKLLLDISKDNLKNENENKSEVKDRTGIIQNEMQNVRKKTAIKAFSAPASDTESEFRRNSWLRGSSGGLKKISEKFHVEGLFQDVAGSENWTTVGSFRGIPHKRAVLAAFQSMDNVNHQSSYEYTVSQMEDFAKKNGIVNAQTYHTDFPHLPTTAPNKYKSRYDAAASGFILRKDLLRSENLRRHSAPGVTNMKLNFITNV